MTDEVDDQTEDDQSEPSDDAVPTAVDPTAVDPTAFDGAAADPQELGEIDVVGIEADLDGVQVALTRLADGTYWTDEVSGAPIPADVLAANPLARRA